MSLSRRQFFRRFLGPADKENAQRVSRYEVMETYVRTHLLPYDFSLSAEQESELFAEVRSALQNASNDELFSVAIRARIEEMVDAKIQPWREESRVRSQAERIREIRHSAPDYVTQFLSMQGTPAAIDQLKQRFGTEDAKSLEAELKRKVEAWIAEVDDEQLLQYDIFTVRDLVFAQLRSWC